ncbi:hypothetical protein [Arcobacter porcinus]|uniref:Uncharacterized protein n=1 Tax=Arcobacter porcinus TaxID=1935204 RepID=A0A1C0AXU7_9BACT|nr:hypothetical protein [Arcobacter porcinus]OCL94438.1 hypothetical protein AAX27_00735 [Aliarcobacter thereius]OCL83036.1 hypothetical protein AAW30_01110 [Arcobacter porcinus]OCL83473.1 hypothetical protein AAW29_01067 [Arcobacter porcinus]OCL88249.1 hypothetical protein AAX30_00859 [Arcobacter porcinus]OCL92469.1 hypothetical protein AAX28_00001 [Arcobacter porcinus]
MVFIISGCSLKEPLISSNSATILFKTPTIKFHDKGFIYKYKNYTQLQVFTTGKVIFDVKIYNNEICTGTFKCMSLKEFNKNNLSSTYEDNFIKQLFDENNKISYFKDSKNGILIKINRD